MYNNYPSDGILSVELSDEERSMYEHLVQEYPEYERVFKKLLEHKVLAWRNNSSTLLDEIFLDEKELCETLMREETLPARQ